MRNSILVKNTAYYTSSLKEKDTLAVIKCITDFNYEMWENNKVSNIFIKDGHLEEYITGVLSTIVINNIKDEVLNDKYITTQVSDYNDYTIYVLDKENIDDEVTVCMNPVFNPYKELININVYGQEYLSERIKRRSEIYISNSEVIKKEYENININNTSIVVQNIESKDYNIRDEIATVIKTPKRKEDGFESMGIIEIDVANKSNGGSENGASSGGDLKKLTLTIQQMSFFEFKMKFESKEVNDVFNLPTGLFFDKDGQRIIGTPMKSGKYSISIIFSDNSSLDGSIDVPKLNRKL